MKLLSVLFLAILVSLHGLADSGAAALPLSMFREGPLAVLGYLAFLPLIAIGPLMFSVSWRSGAYGNASFYALATLVLVFVSVTPSEGPGHVFWSLALPLLFYVYYARVLLEAESLWVFFHLLMPGVLGIATQSFGLCQKWLILYFLVVANVHYEILAVPLQRDTVRRARAERSGRPAIKSAAVPQTRASWALRIASAPAEAARVRSPSRSILARGRWSTSSASRSFQPPKGKCG